MELGQLRSRLAAEFEVGASRGNHAAQQRGEALAQELGEAWQQCTQLAGEAEVARAEAARLAGALDGAQAALQAAQRELEEVKGLLVLQEAAGGSDAGADGTGAGATSARLAQLEQHNRQLAVQLQALQGEAGRHAASAAGVWGEVQELQQVGRLRWMDGGREGGN